MALQEVTVISHHTHIHKDKHLGIEYVFNPNRKVQIPLAAAVHFFGLRLSDPSVAWKRYGYTNDDKGRAFIEKFEIKVVDLVASDEVDLLKEKISKYETSPSGKIAK